MESHFGEVLLPTAMVPNTPKCPTALELAAKLAAFSVAIGTTEPLPFPMKKRPTPLPHVSQGVLVRTHISQTWPNTPKLPIHSELARVPTAEKTLDIGILSRCVPLSLILKHNRGILRRSDAERLANLPSREVTRTRALVVRRRLLHAVLFSVLRITEKFLEEFIFGTMVGASIQIPYLGHLQKLEHMSCTIPPTLPLPCPL